jgi:hypothetical protein
MTSKQQSITSMISVVAEGRCALLATYQIFQFIVGYAMAQAFATNLMYTHALQMGNYQFLIGVSGHSLVLHQCGWRVSTACRRHGNATVIPHHAWVGSIRQH